MSLDVRQHLDEGMAMPLVAMCLGVFIIANDFCALSVALPQIEREFDADVTTVQWVINAYALVFGMLIVTGGRLADLYGRRQVFFMGSALFATFSVLGGTAPSLVWLILCRALMGIGGALIWPAVLGMTYAVLPKGKAALAGSLIIGTAGLGNAMGPLIGGFLTDALSWRWILLVNLPITLFAAFVTWRKVHMPVQKGSRETLDYRGIALLSLGLVALLLALDEVVDLSWSDPRIVFLLVLSVISITMFGVAERQTRQSSLVPRDVMSNRQFAAACLAVLFISAAFFVAVVYLPQFMQKLLNYTPLVAGLGLLPMMGVFACTSFVAGPLYQRLGARLVVSLGALFIAGGMFLLSLITTGSSYVALVPGMVVLGIGIGLFYSSITTAGVTALDASRTSLAGGIVYMFQVAGGAIGLGFTTTFFASVSQEQISSATSFAGSKLTGAERSALDGILAGTESARRALSGFQPEVVARITDLVRDSFVAGFEVAFRIDAALAAAGFLVAVLFVSGGVRRRQKEPQPS